MRWLVVLGLVGCGRRFDDGFFRTTGDTAFQRGAPSAPNVLMAFDLNTAVSTDPTGFVAPLNVDDAPLGLVAAARALPDGGGWRSAYLRVDDQRILVFDGDGASTGGVWVAPAAQVTDRIALADVDGDGVGEVVAADAGGAVQILTAAGAPVAAFQTFPGARLAAGDVDGDGADELVALDPSTPGGRIVVYAATGVELGSSYLFSPLDLAVGTTLAAHDLNGDGADEILVGSLSPIGAPRVHAATFVPALADALPLWSTVGRPPTGPLGDEDYTLLAGYPLDDIARPLIQLLADRSGQALEVRVLDPAGVPTPGGPERSSWQLDLWNLPYGADSRLSAFHLHTLAGDSLVLASRLP